jgi:O-antigen ligase
VVSRGHNAALGSLSTRLFGTEWSERTATTTQSRSSIWLLLALPIAALLFAGLALENGSLTLAGAVLALAVAIIRPDIGLLTLLLVAPFLNRPILPAPGFQFFFVGAIIAGSVYRLPLDRPRISVSPLFWLIFAYVLYAFVQQAPDMVAGYPGGEDIREIGSMMSKLLTALGLVVATALVVSRRSPYPYFAAVIGSAAAVCVVAALVFISPGGAGILDGLTVEPVTGARASGVFENPNYFGQFAAVAALLTIGLLPAARGPLARTLMLAMLAILGLGLLVSQSRGSLVAFVIGATVMAFARSRRTGFIVLFLGLIGAAIIMPIILEHRVSQSAGYDVVAAWESQARSDAFRVRALLAGPDLFLSSPIFGVGLFGFVLETGMYPHNWFVMVLTEQGLVGGVLFAAAVLFAVRAYARLATTPRSIGLGFLAAILASSFFLEPQSQIQSSLMLVAVMTSLLVADLGMTVGQADQPPRQAPVGARRFAAIRGIRGT